MSCESIPNYHKGFGVGWNIQQSRRREEGGRKERGRKEGGRKEASKEGRTDGRTEGKNDGRTEGRSIVLVHSLEHLYSFARVPLPL